MTLDKINCVDAFSIVVKYGNLLSANKRLIARQSDVVATRGVNRQDISDLNKLFVSNEKYESIFTSHKEVLLDYGLEYAADEISSAHNAEKAEKKIVNVADIHARIDDMEKKLMDISSIGIELSEVYVRQVTARVKNNILIGYGYRQDKQDKQDKQGKASKRVSQKSLLGLSGKGRLSNAQREQILNLKKQDSE